MRVDLWALATAPTSSSLRLSEGRSGLSRQDSSRAESKARFREIIPVLVRRPGVAPGRSSMTTDGLQPSPGLLPGYRPVRSAGHQGAREEHEREPKSRRATWFARVALRIEVGGTGPTFLEPPRADRRDGGQRDSRRRFEIDATRRATLGTCPLPADRTPWRSGQRRRSRYAGCGSWRVPLAWSVVDS